MEPLRKAVRPKAHAAPRENAMFRTFGSLYSRGNYHVFFEHFPFGLYSSRRYIAHSTSEDLLLWHNDPMAIYPTKKEDEDGAYEGSAIADEKRRDRPLLRGDQLPQAGSGRP
uniref:Glyco_hydro_32N n=1 Tax=uncultured Leishmania TaxID=1208841 RepID=A0A060C044_9TRYP|nr:Glyco_hydro_32N [uncultured Leishmania]